MAKVEPAFASRQQSESRTRPASGLRTGARPGSWLKGSIDQCDTLKNPFYFHAGGIASEIQSIMISSAYNGQPGKGAPERRCALTASFKFVSSDVMIHGSYCVSV
ncbi:hypothetical protein EVAR_67157_1 [Eumeta japonica]|uniref:Uncharacterized protein n=1 Tax=Eumeta variegata TaxID=151549 RepID=A0A4C1ZT77_EUMVA|nr:hypothetical protein EVAR_67157_1 [Eumeta japonica]